MPETASGDAPQSKLDYALYYAGRGVRVFPVRSNTRIAAVEDWPGEATTDRAKIAAWWRSNPSSNGAPRW